LKDLIEELLRAEAVTYEAVEQRAKEVSSFEEKIHREGKSYDDPIRQVTDLAGLRIILYYVDDVDRVCSVLSREFEIDESKSVDKNKALAPDQFGYISVHKIIKIGESRADLPEWSDIRGLSAEVQVRTVLQHSWAAIDHALRYNRDSDVPAPFRRRLVRLSGLLELADQEFAALRREQSTFTDEVARHIAEGSLGIPVDSISVRQFAASSTVIAQIDATADAEGMLTSKHLDTMDDAYEVLDEGISALTSACQIVGILTVADLEKRLVSLSRRACDFFRKFLSLSREQSPNIQIGGTAAHLAAMLLLGSQRRLPDPDVRRQIGWREGYLDRVLAAGRHVFGSV
jgi:putative GTP pyrophosphokinase